MRDKILDMALRQFLKYGIRKVSIQKLSGPLGISTKTVYKYFSNKEELLENVLLLYRNRRYGLMAEALKTKPAVSLLFDIWYTPIIKEYRINKAFYHDLHYYYPAIEQKVESLVEKKVWEELTAIVERGMAGGFIRKNTDAGILFNAISTLYKDLRRTTNYKKFKAPVDKLFANTIGLLLRGICTDKGVEQLDEHINAVMALETFASDN